MRDHLGADATDLLKYRFAKVRSLVVHRQTSTTDGNITDVNVVVLNPRIGGTDHEAADRTRLKCKQRAARGH